MTLPLGGITVIDVSQYAAGPIATLLLGDYGADIVKIEPINGDPFRPTRTSSLGDTNPGFLSLNRNKRSVAVDLRTADGQAIVQRLTRGADVFVENFRPGVADRLNLGYERLRQQNEGLVYCSISGFGATGEYAQRPSVDVIAQGVAGIMDQTGEADGEPTLVGTPLADYMGGIFGSYGILLALLEKNAAGRGRHVEVSLVDGLLFILGVRFADVLATGGNPPRRGSGHTQTAPGGVFIARDGRFSVAVLSPMSWEAFCDVLGIPEVGIDPRFASNVDRVKNRTDLLEVLGQLFITNDRDHWLGLLASRGIPCGPVNSLVDVLNDQWLNGIVTTTTYDGAGEVRMVGPPVKLDGVPGRPPSPPPRLGANTHSVLKEAGFSDDELRAWAEAGVIR